MKRILIILSIIILIILLLISIINLKGSEPKVNDIDISNDMSYVQGPLKKNIEKLEYNSIEYLHITDKEMAKKYFQNYIQKATNDIKSSYATLDFKYKEKKFNTYEKYNEYVQEKINILKSAQINSIEIKQNGEKKQYTIKDQYGNTYIFKETAVMDYTVQLDDYTLENEEFNEKYKKAVDRDRGILNIDKFFKMINMQDFESAYSVLDNNFKQNYFRTQADFENYMKNKTFRYNKVNYKEYSNKITNLYTYKVTLTDITEEKQGEVEFNIVMKLLEGTDFVMSFEVK